MIRPGATPARTETIWASEWAHEHLKPIEEMTQNAAALAFLWSQR